MQELGALYVRVGEGEGGGAKVMSVELSSSFIPSQSRTGTQLHQTVQVKCAVTIEGFDLPTDISLLLDLKVQRSFNSKQHTILKLC